MFVGAWTFQRIDGPRAYRLSRSHRQLLQQRLRFLQIERVETFREPPVNRSQQFARLLHLALVAPKACEAHGGAEFPGLGSLLASDRLRTIKICSCFNDIPVGRNKCNFRQRSDWNREPLEIDRKFLPARSKAFTS